MDTKGKEEDMNQEILAEVKSTMTYDIFKKYFLFSLFRRKSYKQRLAIFCIIFSIGGVVSLYSIISFGFDAINTILLLMLLVLAFLMTYLVIFAPKNYYKTAKKVIENPTIYRFTSEYIEVELIAEAISGNSIIKYDSFHKIYEIGDMFYLYISNRQAHIVPKNDIEEETLKKLRIIFKSKLGKKYHNYSNR
ncbi:YcxB family protein [Clostridium sp. C8-1-8]|uniref:YcxB family protein n=1 Tax=Clostridium sp. C8-1-8 TaxID=2698831 RepID=UPI001370B7F0|nr:YcxB family protein [Clostridium sp. C8-1-8]